MRKLAYSSADAPLARSPARLSNWLACVAVALFTVAGAQTFRSIHLHRRAIQYHEATRWKDFWPGESPYVFGSWQMRRAAWERARIGFAAGASAGLLAAGIACTSLVTRRRISLVVMMLFVLNAAAMLVLFLFWSRRDIPQPNWGG